MDKLEASQDLDESEIASLTFLLDTLVQKAAMNEQVSLVGLIRVICSPNKLYQLLVLDSAVFKDIIQASQNILIQIEDISFHENIIRIFNLLLLCVCETDTSGLRQYTTMNTQQLAQLVWERVISPGSAFVVDLAFGPLPKDHADLRMVVEWTSFYLLHIAGLNASVLRFVMDSRFLLRIAEVFESEVEDILLSGKLRYLHSTLVRWAKVHGSLKKTTIEALHLLLEVGLDNEIEQRSLSNGKERHGARSSQAAGSLLDILGGNPPR
ncbi:hypothetical protein BLNAU_15407 [Blattamonas nauphoetae]|uniref:Uncharacterized protein n=1 Tax=Blattamonas nauphoetae TaxID=2049346 RepID=A0ABQ9XAU9_9EUKA|nr:hypothetical protein BLNAU_15407 [Blattamonas nauphoetae]